MVFRKVLLIALMAVILLGSVMDASVTKSRTDKHRRRAAEPAAVSIAAIDPCSRSCITNLVKQVTSFVAGDPNGDQATVALRLKRHRDKRASLSDLKNEIAGVAAGPSEGISIQVDIVD